MEQALINKIIPFSSVDGPGNRLAIFLQGCNLNCLYCHNPETINICIHCGICVKNCPYKALSFTNKEVIWNKSLCMECDSCIKVCPNYSSPKTLVMDVNDILKEINKVKPFISGITISGGECTLQSKFLISLFKEVKNLGLTSFLDTNGFISLQNQKELIKYMDMAMVDLKSYDSKEHKNLTGVDNKTVISNIKYLSQINKLYEIRTVIVPNILNNCHNVDMTSRLIASLNPNIRYKIIKYRPLGVRHELINSYSPSDDVMNNLGTLATKNGCKNIILI
ncbi:YjjW family glycine radical enzyme activase [Clostridium brassicae]|uniref:YjjW family glycine radical enzyme activase n=1 Tax=Clostridium brassicae TaxID=2999072 RepID=A0ABT4D4D6_9CLOT|nr:YjjW family glycine radical enzyme activase [Clostridium brassicae]MCY6957148.1 YjjW family glycine radical enzyme activase [Clostridium brassicae]